MQASPMTVSMLWDTDDGQIGIGYVLGDGFYVNEYLPDGTIQSYVADHREVWTSFCTARGVPMYAVVHIANFAEQLEVLNGADNSTLH